MLVEVELERTEPAHDVLRRIRAVDAEDQLLGPALHERSLRREHRLALGERVELAHVDGDRVRGDANLPRSVLDGAAHVVARRADEVLAAAQEAAAPAQRVEPDDVVREDPLVDLLADLEREHVPVVRLRPRDVHEVLQRRVRLRVPDMPRREVQVVVVEEHRRAGLTVELVEHRRGEVPVHDLVPLRPRAVQPVVEARLVLQVPEVVLDEPERRVRDDVVEPVVGARRRARRAGAGTQSPRETSRRRPRRCCLMRQRDPRRSSRWRSTSRRGGRGSRGAP